MECSAVWCRDLDTTTECAKTSRSIWDVDMEKERQNKNVVVLDTVGEGRIMLERI